MPARKPTLYIGIKVFKNKNPDMDQIEVLSVIAEKVQNIV